MQQIVAGGDVYQPSMAGRGVQPDPAAPPRDPAPPVDDAPPDAGERPVRAGGVP
jgi:hypothetical protein